MLPSSHNGNDPNIAPFPFFGDLITNPKPNQDLFLPFSSLINFPPSPLSTYTEQDGFIFLPPALPDYSFPDNKVDVMESSKQLLGINEGTTNDHTKGDHQRKEVVPRKRSSKKDRHSKIETAQGPRDRRMRLSLDVARKFFDLQDMLGFDKASKTVEWLLNQSRSAIKDLSKDFSNTCKLTGEEPNSLSECDVVSGVCDEAIGNFNDEDRPDRPEHVSKGSQSPMKVRKTGSQASMRKVSSTQLARESREKARVRAKERTREKMLIRKLNGSTNNGSKMTAETSEEEGKSQLGHNNTNLFLNMQEVQAEVDEPKWLLQAANEEIMTEDSLTMSTGNYLQNNVNYQENQFRYSQLYFKPWEAYNGSSCNF